MFLLKLQAAAVLSLIISASAFSQVDSLDVPPTLTEVNLSGPRLGLAAAVSNGKFLETLRQKKMDRTLSQFGWQFEYKIVPDGGGPAFVVEVIPLVAGVEYGVLFPSVNVPLGVRFPNGFEFGLGPQLLVTGDRKEPVTTALVMATGKTFLYRGVGLPINLAVVKGSGGWTAAAMFGYAIVKNRSRRSGSGRP
jgi:hypothetical protein